MHTIRRARPGPARVAIAVLMLSAGAVTVAAPPAAAADVPLTQHVNPFIGTDDSNSPNPVPGGAGGSTIPGPVLPFGMVQFSPDTPTASPSGYRFADNQIEGYSLTHFNGAGCPNNEDIVILPITGAINASPGSNWTSYRATQNKSAEVARPGYYKAVESNFGDTQVELTATSRVGRMRLTYPATNSARVLLNASRSATGDRTGSVEINAAGTTITGTHTAGGFCGSSKTFPMFYAMQVDRTPTGRGTFNGGTLSNGASSVTGGSAGGYLTFDTTANRVVNVKVAISFVSIAGAQANLAAEAPGYDFDATRTAADARWNSVLNKVQVTGGTAADAQKFYTALYHVFQNPNISSDVNGQYRGFDNAVHTASHPVYQNWSGWDVYRSWAALIAFLAPAEASDMAKSMVLDAQQGGLLPKWSHQNQEAFVMTGDPGPIIVSSMHAFGARDFDTAEALAAMQRSYSGGTQQGSPIRGRQPELNNNQFMPGESSDGLEYLASDFAIAKFAQRLGRGDVHDALMPKAQWWRNHFNTDTGFITTRHAGGAWQLPLDPASPSNFTEGNAAQYTWMVTYNFESLFNLMGGRETAIQRLDHHFAELNAGLSRPFFYIGNEPQHGVPWAYNFARRPSGTSSVVRRIMNESFTTGPGGLPGNDDLGATSAWYVWAALGMYPATPGADTLALHGPLFPSMLVQRPGGNVQINAAGAGQSAPYVQSFARNGTASSRSFVRYGDLAAGATLSYTMGAAPSAWGTGAGDEPPSFNEGFTPPPPAPELGVNLARGRTASSPQPPCAAGEEPTRAVDGMLVNNSKWCTLTTPSELTVDLGGSQSVSRFVVKHAGLGAEVTAWNTRSFVIETSTDGATFSNAVTVDGNTASRTVHTLPAARTARHVRLRVLTPTSDAASNATRIYELEVYGSGGSTNVALGRPATADSSCNASETPDKAVNGSVGGGNGDKWCSGGANKFLQVDLGRSATVRSFTVRHAGAGGEPADWNTRDYDLEVSDDGTTWRNAAQVRGNTASVSEHRLATPATGRHVRLTVITPTSNGDTAARIYELEVYE